VGPVEGREHPGNAHRVIVASARDDANNALGREVLTKHNSISQGGFFPSGPPGCTTGHLLPSAVSIRR